MSKEIRNGFPLSLHYLLFGKTIGGMRWGGGTLARQAEGRAAVLRQIHSLFQVGAFGDLTDGQLLERFMTGHKESAEPAFAALAATLENAPSLSPGPGNARLPEGSHPEAVGPL